MFSLRKPSALIVSGLLLLQMIGTANAATPVTKPAAAKPASAFKAKKLTITKDMAAQLLQSRAQKTSLDALKGYRDQKLKRSGGSFVPGDGAAKPAGLHNADDVVRVIVTVNGQSVAEKAAAGGQQIQSMDAASARTAAEGSAAVRTSVLSAASRAGVRLEVRHTYDVALSGFSAQMRYGDMAKLSKLAGVKQVSVAQEYEPLDNFSTGTIGASNMWSRTPAVDGQGQVIAIIDTGVDYRHPELGGQTELDPNGKVIGGWNFADDSAQVLDYSGSGHGTHVAGIAAASGAGPQHIKGVAPNAKILAQKVFSNDINNKSAYTDDLVAAINDAVDVNSPHHMGVAANVLNMSLGARSGFADPTDPEQVAVANAANAGAVVAISAGNSSFNTSAITNPDYPFYSNQDIATLGSPGTAPEAITVASSKNAKVTIEGRGLVAKINGAAYSGGHYTVYLDGSSPFGAFQTMAAASLPLVMPSSAANEKGCNASDWTGVDLTGKVALIKRGTCTFQIKTDMAAAAGAKAVVIFNQNADPDITSMAVDAATIPAVMVMNSYGTDLQTALKAGKQVKVAFNGQNQRLQLDDAKGDTMSSFSSWGTTPELGFKPDLTAPGGNIYSTVPNGQYEIMNGTSMAAPHVAGAAALIKQAHPAFTAADIKAALMNTAKVLKPSATANPYSPRQQGAGRIQVDKAIDTNVVVTAGTKHAPSLTLGAVQPKSITPFTLTVKNSGTTNATFNLSGSVYRPSASTSGTFNTLGSTPLAGAAINFSGGSNITVPAGQSITVNGIFDLLNVADPQVTARYGYFAEGFITLTSTTAGQPDLTVPHMSFVGDWIGANAQPIIDPMMSSKESYTGMTGLYAENPLYKADDPKSGSQWLGLGFSLDGTFDPENMAVSNSRDNMYDVIGKVSPGLSFLRNAQSVQIEVVDPNGRMVDRIGADPLIRNLAASEMYLGKFWEWDVKEYNRNWGQRERAADGQYAVRVRTLSPGASADNAADWQTYTMPLKVDNSSPDFTFNENVGPTTAGAYALKWTDAYDEYSGMYGIVPVLDEKVLFDQWQKPTANGEITVNIPFGNHVMVGLCLLDYAGNAECKGYEEPFTTNAIQAAGPTEIQTNKAAVSLPYTFSDGVKQVTVQEGAAEPVKAGTTGSIDLNLGKDGKHTVVVRAYAEEAAATLLGELTYNIDVDMTPPIISLTSPDFRMPLNSGAVIVKGTVTEAHPKDGGVLWSIDGSLPAPVTLNPKNEFEFPLFLGGDGRHNLKFITEDAAPFNNHGEMARAIILGTAATTITTNLDPTGLEGSVYVLYTGNGDYTLTGTTANPTNNYTFRINGEVQYTTAVADPAVARKWSYKVSGIFNNNLILELEAKDEAGNPPTTQKIYFQPTGSPWVTAQVAAPVTNAASTTVTGFKDDKLVSLEVNGAPIPAVGRYYTATVDLTTEGKKDIAVLGRTTSAKDLFLALTSVIKDTTAPVVTVKTPANASFQRGAFEVSGTIKDATPTTVTVDDQSAAVTDNMHFSLTHTPAGLDGVKQIVVVATDAAGNASEPATVTYTLDTTPPVVVVDPLPTTLQPGTVKVTGKVTDVNFESLKVNATAVTPAADGTFSTDLKFTTDGVKDIIVEATDKAGNSSPIVPLSVTVDANAPVITITSPAASTVYVSPTVDVTGTVQDTNTLSSLTVNGNPVSLTTNTVSLTQGSFSTQVTLGADNKVTVVATDAVGNTSTKTVDVKRDTILRNLTVNREGTWSPAGGNLKISFDLATAGRVTLGVYGEDGKLKVTLVNNATRQKGTNTVEWNGKIGSKVVDGTYEIRLTAGAASLSQQTTIYSVTPAKPTVAVTFDGWFNGYTKGNLQISGSVGMNVTQVVISATGPSKFTPVTLNLRSVGVDAIGARLIPIGTTFRSSIRLNGKDGLYNFTVVAKDALGNSSAPATFTATLDTTKPKKPTVKVQGYVTQGTLKVDVRTSEPGILYLGVMDGGMLSLKDVNALHEQMAAVLSGGPLVSPGWYEIRSTSITITLPVDSKKPDGTYNYFMPDGKYEFGAVFFDRAGNIGVAADSGDPVVHFEVIVDRDAPNSPGITSANVAPAGTTYELKGTVSDDGSGVASVTVNNVSVKVNADGSFKYSKALPRQINAVTKFTIVVTDKTGKKTTFDYTVTTN